ncbi:unnamed protein product, partial [Iphiclides podalirius]
MRVFLAEDNLCAQNLLKLVSHGNAILAEILRLKSHIPTIYLLDNKELQQKYQDVIMDFSYFKISDDQEKKINANGKLQDMDDDLKEKYLELITRFYLLFENIYQYIVDLNTFVDQLNDGAFIQQTIDSVMKDVEGKQLLCESAYLYGSMLLLCDLYIPGQVRERLLVAFYRYSTSQSQSNVDDVCKLLRDTGYDQQHARKPLEYPVELFSRVPIQPEFVDKVVEMVFHIVEKIIDLQTWSIKEVPTRIEKEKLREYAQLEHRMEVAKLTHSASTFTTGILDMRSTLVGVIRVDPAELLEEGLLRELDTHISKKFNEFLEPQVKKPGHLISRLQKLAESMDGYKRSLEYIQDYINIHGLRIWQKQVSAIITENVNKEISLRKGVSLYGPSAGFMGFLARQIAQLTDSRVSTYINICTAWFDVKTQKEVVNTKTFAKLNEAIGVVGLHGLDTLYAFMIKNQLQNFQAILRNPQEKVVIANVNLDTKDIEQVTSKCTKTIQQITDVLLLVGGLQLLRKHLSYQLNTSCKFDSANLEASLRTMNEALINVLKAKRSDLKSMPLALIHDLEEYLVRCGINEPFQKVYVKRPHEFSNSDMGRFLAVVLISQLSKLQICYTTGDLITKKPGENIDGFPLLVGTYTLLHQSSAGSKEVFIDTLCQYAKVAALAKLKSSEVLQDSAFIVRMLQLFCETFNYKFEKLEEKLPLALISSIPQK